MGRHANIERRQQREDEVAALLTRKGPMRIDAIAAELGWSYRTTLVTLERMRTGAPKKAFFAGFLKCGNSLNGGGRYAHLYAAGDAPDAPRPEKLTDAERQRLYRQRMSAEEKDFYRARDRARKWRPKRDIFVAALFGEYRPGVAG